MEQPKQVLLEKQLIFAKLSRKPVLTYYKYKLTSQLLLSQMTSTQSSLPEDSRLTIPFEMISMSLVWNLKRDISELLWIPRKLKIVDEIDTKFDSPLISAAFQMLQSSTIPLDFVNSKFTRCYSPFS